MKIILSRKGFDSSAGGVANPILPNGDLISFPIPDADAPLRYRDIRCHERSLGPLVRSLTRGRFSGKEKAHLDPDLDFSAIPRPQEWRPLFGQSGAAQGHLQKMEVAPGDLFLFFGWFRQTRFEKRRLVYQKNAPDRHIFFGWMQISEIIDLNQQEPKSWMRQHPHCFGQRGKNNVLYVAAKNTVLPNLDSSVAGAGLFPKIRDSLVLTAPGSTRRYWKLPSWFHPSDRRSCLTYHQRPDWWEQKEDSVILKSAARGQDFVLDCEDYPEATKWAAKILESGVGQ